ncbi:hypothetical protein G9A89_003993 [Geosiphon pyriformis]|nr:hypothetical protein G9A89_003993 [Geosiphon pyriformis]
MPTVIPKRIQVPNWKKQRIESPIYPSYHHILGSTINITSTNVSISMKTPIARISFQSKQAKDFDHHHISQISELLQNLSPVIVINQPPIELIGKSIQPPQVPSQQPIQPVQQMVYTPIAKIEKFTGKKDDAQVWLNNVKKAIIANGWNDACALQAIPYFLQDTYFNNNNSINYLTNTFTSIRQGETEAVTTYLGCFHLNLRQIQAININYFTVPQILNQFICGLCSSILQYVHPLHPANLQATLTIEQSINCHNNATIRETPITSKISHIYYLQPIDNGNKKCIFATIVVDKNTYKLIAISFPAKSRTIPTLTSLCANDTATNLSTTNILSPDLSSTATSNILTATTNNLSTPNGSDTTTKLPCQQSPKAENHPTKLAIVNGSPSTDPQLINPTIRILLHYLSLLVTPKDASPNKSEPNQQSLLTRNIPPAIVTKDQSLAAIFSFELEEPSNTPLFSRAVFNKKPITAMYTDVKVDDQFIKLILDINRAASARIITADGVTKTSIGEIDDFPFDVNGIVTLIKVLVMEVTQYQALVDNDWLSKANLAFNGQHTQVPAMCGHFKVSLSKWPLIELEEKKTKPTWEAYQVLWADNDHNKLLPILSWNNKGKKKKEELAWKLNLEAWSDDSQSETTTE